MIRFISVNIEGSKHLDRVKALILDEKPDVLCVQEVLKRDVPFLTDLAGPSSAWAPMHYSDFGQDEKGIAIFSRHRLADIRTLYYTGDAETLPVYVSGRDYGVINASNHCVVVATMQMDGGDYRIGTTHVPVTRNGSVTPEQLQAIQTMLDMAASEPELILCGDFNAPRGRESFDTIAAVYKDNIPAHYITSIDAVLHKYGAIPDRMVDGLFTTPHYQAMNVRLQDGVSDHCAIVADIART